MTRRSIDLLAATDPAWAHAALEDFDTFLQDHANCERKASAVAMSLVVKYPDRTRMVPPLIALAQEELAHFGQVYELMAARGLPIVRDAPDPYVNALLRLQRHGREAGFLDRMLISSLIECRGAERFGLVAEALRDPQLKAFYQALWASEVKHGHQFVELVLPYFEQDVVYARLYELAAREAEIMHGLAWRAALH